MRGICRQTVAVLQLHVCLYSARAPSHQVWQCGGAVLIATCSRVGHVFRKVSPYTWPGGVVRILNHNTLRTVHVWMDEYKDFFLKINPSTYPSRVSYVMNS